MTLRAYRLNEYEWWAGRTPDEAIQTAQQVSGCDLDEVVDDMVFTGEPESDLTEVCLDEACIVRTSCGAILASMTAPGFAFGMDT